MAWVDFGWVENGTNFGWKTAGGFRRVEKGWVDFGRVDFVYHRQGAIDKQPSLTSSLVKVLEFVLGLEHKRKIGLAVPSNF